MKKYIIVKWPEVQELMEEDWFDEEAVFINDDKFPSSSYFIPIDRTISTSSKLDNLKIQLENNNDSFPIYNILIELIEYIQNMRDEIILEGQIKSICPNCKTGELLWFSFNDCHCTKCNWPKNG